MDDKGKKLEDQLKKRCSDAKVRYEVDENDDGEKVFYIYLRCGRKDRAVYIQDCDDLDRLLSVPFEKYTFIGDYEAICSFHDGEIEAEISALDGRSIENIYRIISNISKGRGDTIEENILEIRRSDQPKDIKIILGSISDEFSILTQSTKSGKKRLSLKILNLNIDTHDKALTALETISNALFFQIDLSMSLSLKLTLNWWEINPSIRIIKRNIEKSLVFPRMEYDVSPMAFYWYAKSAVGMPLLQYLSYYQVVEYYFTPYAETDAKKKIQNIIKNPRFRADSISDISKVLAVLRSKGSKGYGNERSQLKATLKECVDLNEIKNFLTSDADRLKYFKTKNKKLTDHLINLEQDANGVYDDLAGRIYDIRCRIVHTKSDEDDEFNKRTLLPFSKESNLLYHDIDLLEVVSQQVLISSSTNLRLL